MAGPRYFLITGKKTPADILDLAEKHGRHVKHGEVVNAKIFFAPSIHEAVYGTIEFTPHQTDDPDG